ncbi:MAG: alpha/beta hydrolase [Proteobacteria bacterium]|nr:alpha/beta hydrolase [Pseudomonadota bacterium]
MKNVVFVHGLGLNSDAWSGVFYLLKNHAHCNFIDLGFIKSNETSNVNEILNLGDIFVGHSIGLLWILCNLTNCKNAKGIISVASIPCFFQFMQDEALLNMKNGFISDITQSMFSFWNRIGFEGDVTPHRVEDVNLENMQNGIEWLRNWDGRSAIKDTKYKILALASRDDVVVTEEISKEVWGDYDLKFCDNGSHIPHIKNPFWIASNIIKMLHEI